jgi:protein TonB
VIVVLAAAFIAGIAFVMATRQGREAAFVDSGAHLEESITASTGNLVVTGGAPVAAPNWAGIEAADSLRPVDPLETSAAVELDLPTIPDPPAPPPPESEHDTSRVETAPEPPPSEGGPAGGDHVANAEPQASPDAPKVAAPLVPPVLLKAAWLPYPDGALKRKAEAHVEVRILVGEDGSVASVELAEAAVDTALARAAIESARSMKFKPASRGGVPVPVWYSYRFDFSLPGPG